MSAARRIGKGGDRLKFRHEYKHRVNLADIIQLRTRLAAVAEHDPHCGSDGTYIVNSLYFDNYMDKALREKIDGVNHREKFRIRYYADDISYIRLEKKSKINGLCSKESTAITAEECVRLIGGDKGFLIGSGNELMQELYAKMTYQLLRPKCIVAYNRECFVYPPGNVRVTLDTDICGSYRVGDFLKPDQQLLRPCSVSVLEVKWDEFLPQIIRDAVQVKGRRTAPFSKYAAVRY